MIKTIVTGHGNFASGCESVLNMIAGTTENFIFVEFLPSENSDNLSKKLLQAYTLLDFSGKTIVLADLAGGTPFNLSVKLFWKKVKKVEL